MKHSHIPFFGLVAIMLCCCTFNSMASDRQQTEKKMKFSGYEGGMMVHSGFVSCGPVSFVSPSGQETSLAIKGAPLGIGGSFKAGFGRHLRIGGEGYMSTLNYGAHKSSESIGWGGVLADCVWTKDRWSWFIGGTVGGGSVKNITLLSDMPADFILENTTTSYRRYGFVALVPFAGVEYAITERVHLMLRADWIINVSNPQPDFATGPRLHVGFMFYHSR